MIIGVGIDVVDVSRFEQTLQRTPAMRARLFTAPERDLPVLSLAARFAAKEAIAKALGAPPGLVWTDVTVHRGEHGRPWLDVTGGVADLAGRLGVTSWHVSLSHDGGVATAVVIAEGRDVPTAPQEDR